MKNNKITLSRFLCLLIAALFFIFWIKGFSIVLLLVSLAFTLLFGRLWCGYICPLGFYQELLSRIRKRFRLPSIHLSPKTKGILKPIKYLVLAGFIANAVVLGVRPIIYLRPDLAIASPNLKIWDIVLMGIITGFCFFNERFFCKICPLGTLRGFANKISMGKIKKKGSACTHCRACYENCPMDIKEIFDDRSKTNFVHADCIYCMKCIEACPEPDVLSYTVAGKKLLSSKRKIK
ncbi:MULTISPECIES: 4Fe-4S binding protein [Clostridiaceae]|uniref:4Fe-4S binding protein n=1 Tax=Clostridiaceae TaxID=31979 RepID=UPI0005550E8E|nr:MULTISPECIES: 4Fe-4S binding protein [Clostridiaceae]